MRRRYLELGPGNYPLEGFEGLDVVRRPGVTHVADATKGLPFPNNTFSVIYASHIIEHVPWYETARVLKDWVSKLVSGGSLEIWTVDAIKVAHFLLEAEASEGLVRPPDKWKQHNPQRDPFLWANGRVFAYEKPGAGGSFFWHKALFTPVSLKRHLEAAGLHRVMPLVKPRGYHHGFINLGMGGWKP